MLKRSDNFFFGTGNNDFLYDEFESNPLHYGDRRDVVIEFEITFLFIGKDIKT